ncbi:hypothetical protein HPB52_000320 [Rhipicephalus sanguineus]|uniref:Uncharacterized protein n=1 Tax=Rhipicephalus sanguineus TaxID=34632 RepID=A0A9D4SPT7_RHISA|nr:hypothetical protein HPB52_000320 [Rhipicephalus sanguineus]
MVVGGKDDKGEALNAVESYDPATNSWMTYRNLPLPIMGCGVCFLGGLVYVVRGLTTKKQVMSCVAPTEMLSTAYATDTNERTWVRRPRLPEPRAYCTALSIKHELWLAGGLKGSGHDSDSFTNVADVLAFDSLRGAVTVDDYIYVVGGASCLEGNSLEDVDVYDKLLTYPTTPPLVRNLTSAGGRISFHSQLPDTGHVLLRILGTGLGSPTWDGSKHSVRDIIECIRSLMTTKARMFQATNNLLTPGTSTL